ncbi:MAG: hypothetical protein GTN53_02495, partial [Candidatus Aminicenantes bacterium]|nr:hypothetical protein [Candidatus Aminicenantes bacterium]NIT21361.1 hypothetical protein [Candidatus Aminicenantes bacterium]
MAQQIYLDVISITGTPQNPTFNGEGPAIEYAVKMKEFRQENQLDRVVARGELHDQHIDGLAQQLADFHQRIEVAREDLPFGSPERIFQPIRENFETISQSITNPIEVQALNHLNEWTIKTHEKLSPYFLQRKQKGFIRECHGDMHLGNMALLGKRVV